MSLDPEPRMRVLVDDTVERGFKLASPRQDVLDFLGPGDPRDARGFEFNLPLEPRAGSPRTVVIEVADDRYVAMSPTFRIHHSPSLALHDDYVDSAPTARSAVDLFAGEWVSELPGDLAAATGGLGLFDDDRITDALEILGGMENARSSRRRRRGFGYRGQRSLLPQMRRDEGGVRPDAEPISPR